MITLRQANKLRKLADDIAVHQSALDYALDYANDRLYGEHVTDARERLAKAVSKFETFLNKITVKETQ